ncbi:EamA family transporter [Arcanobacterium buesumense]|uniref:EamA family transporter n=1 Tax=Arcanobacterium buesumense TaxID=2722751 RepID=A0A6H2EI57_9ACTO|nr:EamA family transporter [Arcanobacterium buesumense]QJC21248.1 EamA family transporter [Arcanobacterium buesumense]
MLGYLIYMYVGRRIAVTGNGLDSLAVGMLTGSLLWLPIAGMSLGPIFSNQRIFWLVMLVALLSSVTPYAMDTVIMRRINASTFALLNSLLPATSFVVGLVILHQVPTIGELAGLVLITAAVGLVGMRPNAK